MRKHNVINKGKTEDGMTINADMNHGVHGEIVDKIQSVMEDYRNSHTKSYVLPVTIKYPAGWTVPKNNSDFRKKVLHSFKQNRDRDGMDCRYVAVPERRAGHEDGAIHYHAIFLLNGSETQHPHHHLKLLEKCWQRALQREDVSGLIHHHTTREGCAGHMIRRDDEEAFQDAFHHATYLAKTRGKENLPPGMHRVMSTRTG
jgi:hypothetical protein